MTQVSRGPGSARKGERPSASTLCSGNHEKAKARSTHPKEPSLCCCSPAQRVSPWAAVRKTLHWAVPTGPWAAKAGIPRGGWLFFFFFQLRLPTCQLMDLITHSGACSWAAACFIHTESPTASWRPGTPVPGIRSADPCCSRSQGACALLAPASSRPGGGAANSPLFTCNSLLRGRRPGEC